MSDLSRLFDQALMVNHVTTDIDQRRSLADAVLKRSVQMKRARARNTTVMAVLAAMAAGSGMWTIAGAVQEPANSEPVPSPTVAPSPDIQNAQWEVDWNGDVTELVDIPAYDPMAIQAPAAFDDGLDHSNLPPLVDRPSPRYPVAHELEPWVWDHVRPGWALATYGLGAPVGRTGLGDAAPRLYLVSPEGIHFEMRSLGPGGPSEISTWQVMEWSLAGAWVQFTGGNYEIDGFRSEIQDLESGDVLGANSGSEGVEGGDGLSVAAGLTEGAQLWLRQPFAPSQSDPYVGDYSAPELTIHERNGSTISVAISGWESGRVVLSQPSADGRHVALMTVDSEGSYRPQWVLDTSARTVSAVEFPDLGESGTCIGDWLTIDATVVAGTQCWNGGDEVEGGFILKAGESSARADSLDGLVNGGLDLVGDDTGVLVSIEDPESGDSLPAAVVEALGAERVVSGMSVTEYAPGRFAISNWFGVTVLYDRDSGDWYPLTSTIMRDSSMTTGLTGLAVLSMEG